MKTKFWIFTLVLGFGLMILANSCKKDEDDSTDTTTPDPTPSTAYSENFSSGVMPSGMTLINDANTVNDQIVAMFPNAWDVIGEPADTANKVAASPSYFAAVAAADRWMITPGIKVVKNMSLAWRGKAQDPNYPDGYKVMISSTGKAKTDFTTTVITLTAETADNWTTHKYDLAAFAGKTIYVAFVQNSTDMFYLLIDDVKVCTTSLLGKMPESKGDKFPVFSNQYSKRN